MAGSQAAADDAKVKLAADALKAAKDAVAKARAAEKDARQAFIDAKHDGMKQRGEPAVAVAFFDLQEATQRHEYLTQEQSRASAAVHRVESDMNFYQKTYSRLVGEARTLSASVVA